MTNQTRTPHKHAEVIKAWADGHTIQTRRIGYGMSEWLDMYSPHFDGLTDLEYRVKPEPPKPHKWQKEIDAQAAGKMLQIRAAYLDAPWKDQECKFSFRDENSEYRIKPKIDVIGFRVAVYRDDNGAPFPFLVMCPTKAHEIQKSANFIRWATDWTTRVIETPV